MKRRLIIWLLARLGVRKGFIEIPQGGVLRLDGGVRITGYDLKMQGHVSGVYKQVPKP